MFLVCHDCLVLSLILLLPLFWPHVVNCQIHARNHNFTRSDAVADRVLGVSARAGHGRTLKQKHYIMSGFVVAALHEHCGVYLIFLDQDSSKNKRAEVWRAPHCLLQLEGERGYYRERERAVALI